MKSSRACSDERFAEQARELVAKMTLEEKIGQMVFRAPAIERLGVPAYTWWNEGLHGVARSGVATVFPQAIGMAASFNTELMERVAEVISTEARAKYNAYRAIGAGDKIYQSLTFWSPNINIFRDPRWGRGQETYGEDPYLTGRMGAAFINGLQGHGKYRKADATIKHYAVHSGPEGIRHGFDAVATEEDMYETYLWAFKYCIDHAHPSAVMGAYNRVNGEPCCASETLLGRILFGEFGFDGYVVSDCGAIRDISEGHHYAPDAVSGAAAAINNGCHLNCGEAYSNLLLAVQLGMVEEETITEAVERLFTARFRLGLFADDCEYDAIGFDEVASEAHAALNLEMAEESIVLLKNDGLLPLNEHTNVAVIGPNADSREMLLGNYNGTPDKYVTLLRGIQEVCTGKVRYSKGCPLYADEYHEHRDEAADAAVVAAANSDVIIMCMGIDATVEGEEKFYETAVGDDREGLALPKLQQQLYQRLKTLGKPIVFVNCSGSPMLLNDQDEHCGAVLQCFYPGALAGRALANILFGRVSPSGKLPVTFVRTVEELPPFEDYSMAGRTYKYMTAKPLYPFGYGLSYSRFEYTDVQAEPGAVSATLTNVGSVAAAEAAQLYLKRGGVWRLRGIEKRRLAPGESVRLRFAVEEEYEELFVGQIASGR